MTYLFSKEQCIKAKSLLGKNGAISSIWRNIFAPSNRIGNCTNLYRILKPKSCEDFFDKYIKYASEHKELPISKRGLDEIELLLLAEKYRKIVSEKTGITHDLMVYYYDALCHIIVETWDGQQNERDFITFLTSLAIIVTNSTER